MPQFRIRIPRLAALFVPLILASTALFGAEFTVSMASDAGPGSLRQAILDANDYPCSVVDQCHIGFAIPRPVPAAGWFTIAPTSPLPIVTRAWVEIDGSSQSRFSGDTNPFGPEIELDGSRAGYRSGIKVQAPAVTVRGLAIHSFEGHGVFLDAASGARVEGNYIGVDPTGMEARPNGMDGVAGRGSSGSIAGNIISGNKCNGVYLTGVNTTSVYANRIGVGRIGELAIPNLCSGVHAMGFGVQVDDNEIAFNRLHGIATDGSQVSFEGNRIYNNGLLGIDVGFDGVDVSSSTHPSSPVLTSASADSEQEGYYTGFYRATGTVRAGANEKVIVSLFASPRADLLGGGEGKIYLGATEVATDTEGNATFEVGRNYFVSSVLEVIGGVATATARTSRGSSEFSAPFPITITTPTFEVTSNADSGPGSLRAAIAAANEADCVDHPCRVTFRVVPGLSRFGIVTIALQFPLPPVTKNIRILGASQSWWSGDTNPFGPEIEINGSTGLQIGTPEAGAARAYVSELAVTGSSGDGITVHASRTGSRIEIVGCHLGTAATGTVIGANAANGIRFVGGKVLDSFVQQAGIVRGCIIGGNGANGVMLDGSADVLVRDSRIGTSAAGLPLPNRGAGVRVNGAKGSRIEDDVIAFNESDGVATTSSATATLVRSSIFENGELGIDVNDDGVSLPNGVDVDGVIDPPVITEAHWDPVQRRTFISGTKRRDAHVARPPGGSFAGDAYGIHWYRSDRPDPSGFGEGQQPLSTNYPPFRPVSDDGTTFTISFEADLQGSFVSATMNRFYCYYEFGCTAEESSEFGNVIEVK